MVFYGSNKRSTIVLGTILWVLELINILKFTYTYEPLTFGDFGYSGNFGEIASIVKDDIWITIWKLVPIFAFLAVIISFLIWIVNKFNVKLNKKWRIISGVTCLIFLMILFVPNKSVKESILGNIYDKYTKNDFEHYSSNMYYYSEESMLRSECMLNF